MSAIFAIAAPVWANPPATSQPVRPFILGRMPPLRIPRHPIARAEKIFPFFKHKPFSTAGFNPMFLPFHHVFNKASHGADRAHAFAFLFSSDLDWAPGNYCSRHAYFTFTRSGPAIFFLRRHYTSALVASYLQAWRATIGIGGTLRHSAAGYTADIVLFNPKGQRVKTLRFTKPMSYWKLLGAAEVSVMTYMGEPPTPALAEFLCLPRCSHMQSVTELGKAAFLPTQSNEAFAVFRKVLKSAPDFADVRYWYDIQRSWRWTTGNDRLQQEIARCLKSRIGPYDSQQFNPLDCSNPKTIRALTAMEPEILIQLKKLTGPESMAVLYDKLEWHRFTPTELPNFLRQVRKVAGRYPNNYYLLTDLARHYQNSKPRICFSPDLSGALSVAAQRDRFMTGMEKKQASHLDLGYAAYDTGHFGMAAVLLLRPNSPADLTTAFWSLVQMGQFRLITRAWPMIVRYEPKAVNNIVPIYALAAAMTSDLKDLDHVIKKYPKVLQSYRILDVMQYCSQRLAGKDISHFVFSPPNRMWEGFRIHLYVMSEYDLARHSRNSYHAMYQHVLNHPLDEIAWLYLDAYNRQDASLPPDAPDFYDALSWLWPDAPWVKSAEADYAARTKTPPARPVNPNGMLHIFAPLDKYPHNEFGNKTFTRDVRQLPLQTTTIFDEVAAVHQLVQRSEFKKALRLAQFVWWHAYVCDDGGTTRLTQHVMYMVKRAAMEAGNAPR